MFEPGLSRQSQFFRAQDEQRRGFERLGGRTARLGVGECLFETAIAAVANQPLVIIGG